MPVRERQTVPTGNTCADELAMPAPLVFSDCLNVLAMQLADVRQPATDVATPPIPVSGWGVAGFRPGFGKRDCFLSNWEYFVSLLWFSHLLELNPKLPSVSTWSINYAKSILILRVVLDSETQTAALDPASYFLYSAISGSEIGSLGHEKINV